MMDNLDCFALMLGGRKSSRLQVFCYQFGGSSNSVEPLAPKDRGVWRCLAVEKLSQVELRTGTWHTESRHSRVGRIQPFRYQPGLSAHRLRWLMQTYREGYLHGSCVGSLRVSTPQAS